MRPRWCRWRLFGSAALPACDAHWVAVTEMALAIYLPVLGLCDDGQGFLCWRRAGLL